MQAYSTLKVLLKKQVSSYWIKINPIRRSSVSWRAWQEEHTTVGEEVDQKEYHLSYAVKQITTTKQKNSTILQQFNNDRYTSSVIPAVLLPSVLNGGFKNPLKCNFTNSWNVFKESWNILRKKTAFRLGNRLKTFLLRYRLLSKHFKPICSRKDM